jgi:hypothetical protein
MKSLLGKLEQWIERAILIAVIGLLLIPTLITNRLRDAAKMEDAVKEAAVTDAASRVGKEPSVVVETLDRVRRPRAPHCANGGEVNFLRMSRMGD